MVFITPLATLISLSTLSTMASAVTVQKPFLMMSKDADENRLAVKDMFLDSYNTYLEHARNHDDVTPVSQGFSDDRNGWGASVIDSLSTMHIMGLDDLFKKGVDFASTVDFTRSRTNDRDTTVSVFETTIRYLGGLLSAYELCDYKYPALLTKAEEVAKTMTLAWVDGHAIPYGHMTPDNTPIVDVSNIAEAGTLSLEWYTLSKYTRNQTYANLGVGAARQVATQPHPLPGLAAQGINPTTGEPVGDYVTWGGGSDSYFEYLIKYARLTNTDDPLWTQQWATAVDSSIKELASRSGVGNWLFLADWHGGGTKRLIGSHLACFHAGNFIYGGRLLNNQTIVDFGLELNEGCWNTYEGSPTGIGPEIFAWKTADGSYSGPPLTAEQEGYYQEHGYYPSTDNRYYYLRPEVLESNFIAWRTTGDQKFQDRAASAVKNFQKYLKVPTGGYAGIWDVTKPGTSSRIDITESFWYAEVLKYLYLTFDNPENISLDNYVFNTEAHPLRAPPSKSTYGDGTLAPTPTEPYHSDKKAPVAQISPGPVLGDRLTKVVTSVVGILFGGVGL